MLGNEEWLLIGLPEVTVSQWGVGLMTADTGRRFVGGSRCVDCTSQNSEFHKRSSIAEFWMSSKTCFAAFGFQNLMKY